MSNQRGDTIIEVLFAITVFSLVAVGALSLMNQGTAMAQRALEIDLVRQQMDAQADALRYLNSAYIEDFQPGDASQSGGTSVASTVWNTVVASNKETQGQDFDTIISGDKCKLPGEAGGSTADFHPFAIDITKLGDALDPDTSAKALPQLLVKPTNDDTLTYAHIAQNATTKAIESQGLWVEAVQAPANKGFYDFHITGCWVAPGQQSPVKLGTIVRLYVPQ